MQTGFFYAPKIGWLRMLIVALFIFNIFIHIYGLAQNKLNPALM